MRAACTMAAAALTLALAPAAHAAVISLESATGVWSNIVGGQNVAGAGTNAITWGDGIAPDSGYTFVGTAPPPQGPYDIGDAFDIGTFTHHNDPIPAGSSITAARLTVDAQLKIDGNAIVGQFVYDFTHNETSNQQPCPPGSVSVCDDIVSFTNNAALSSDFLINGVKYTLTLTGFEVNGAVVPSFLTAEGQNNPAILKAAVTASAVPEPTSLVLVGLGLVGLGARLRRRS